MGKPPGGTDGYQVRAVVRAISVLELLRENRGGASLNELAQRSEMAKASVFRMLRTLEETGMVERVAGTDVYRLGVRCLEFGQAYLEQTDLRTEAAPEMERLRSEFDETVHLGVLDNELRVVYLEKLETNHAIGLMMSRVGRTSPSHCTGIGKALLASQAGDPVMELVEREILKPYTPNTVCEPNALRDELAETHRRGYALDLEEHEPGVRCVAAPVSGAGGKMLAAVSVSGPVYRLPEDLLQGRLAESVQAAAREVGRRLGATPTASRSDLQGGAA